MELNDIKKELYRQNPWAHYAKATKDGLYYYCPLFALTFLIPLNDIQDATFEEVVRAKHLIRWIIVDYHKIPKL